MVEADASVTLPVPPAKAFAALADIEHASWLPGVKSIRKIKGTRKGATYAVQVSVVGKQFDGVLECTEWTEPSRLAFRLKDSLKLDIVADVSPVDGGSIVALTARYSVPGLMGGAIEKTTIGAVRREVARSIESFAAQFARSPGKRSGPAERAV